MHDLAAGRLEAGRRHGLGLGLLRSGAGPDLLRHRQSRARGTPTSGPATTSGPTAIFARDADTGQARWFYQVDARTTCYDYDGINESVLLDMPSAGKIRKVLVRPERNGYIYVIDRATGEVLSAEPFAPVNSTTGRRPRRPAGCIHVGRQGSRRSAR